jgi:hypothetical protein
MHRAREREAEQTLKLTLPCGGAQEVVPPNDIRDPIGCVINDDREVVGPGTTCSPQDEVTDLLGDILRDSPGSPVVKTLRTFLNL